MWQLRKTDHGTDGWDCRHWIVANFTTHDKAIQYLKTRSFTWEEYGAYWHALPERRNTMGAISFRIEKAPEGPEIDPA